MPSLPLKKNLHFLLQTLLILSFGSCSRRVTQPFTSVDKMLKIEQGMVSSQVDTILGIKPYNILHRDDSTSLFEYHYRLRERNLYGKKNYRSLNRELRIAAEADTTTTHTDGSPSNSDGIDPSAKDEKKYNRIRRISGYNEYIHQDYSQSAGKTWYSKPSSFYLLYRNDKVSALITERGQGNSELLIQKNTNLLMIPGLNYSDKELWEDDLYLKKLRNDPVAKKIQSGRHNILYTAVVPWAPAGIKYAYTGKIGGYASLASDFYAIDGTLYLTGGLSAKLTSGTSIYLGGGIGPRGWYDSYYYNYEYFQDYYVYLESPLLEIGSLQQFGHLSLDIGGGISLSDFNYSYGRIGIGINF